MNYEFWMMSLQSAGIGPARRRLLRKRFGGAKGVFCAAEHALADTPRLTPVQVEALIKSRQEWDPATEDKYAAKGICLVTEEEETFPKRLRGFAGAPDALFYKGRLPSDDAPTAAIVGARMCTNYGKEIAGQYAYALAKSGVQVISGLAYGIDGHAHQGALDAGGSTFGVLGCGLDQCYPRAHIRMYTEMQQQGGLLSEYPIGTQPLPEHFPQRNRIISGLADLVLVVEAKEKSGSLITADLALEQGKEVYAVPGRVGDAVSSGCNRLIAQGAGIALTVEEIKRALGIAEEEIRGGRGAKGKECAETSPQKLSQSESAVYQSLTVHAKSMDEIVNQVKLPVPETLSVLLSLQLKGYAQETERGRYARS